MPSFATPEPISVTVELGVGDMSAENLLAAASASIGQVAEALTRIEPLQASHAIA